MVEVGVGVGGFYGLRMWGYDWWNELAIGGLNFEGLAWVPLKTYLFWLR